ncbi:uridylate kinase [Methanoplanus sp. FWC-SCC4]|uniref:Uridylate kinase n=1 Tax=Methanochimaera problematica TaxID=2609417 RepID=A0AA97I3S9_9EURY|nr:uridylate kinase [Methanoplanus sp. FWC-SCC4]WOF17023.1 uridylate kinase [Methanoplanus sp. FWC-SCC4]
MKSDSKPLVVKLGGSLIDALGEIVPLLMSAERNMLIIPGGGVFADNIREINPDPDTAHWMAILAMEQYGYLISSSGEEDVWEEMEVPDKPKVMLPYRILKERDPLPHSWDITSDTIAAWFASELDADLLLLKSVDGLTRNKEIVSDVCVDEKFQEVDPCLISFVLDNNIDTWVINARNAPNLKAFFEGRNFLGTHIHRKFLSLKKPNL